MSATDARGERAAELRRAASILAAMTGDAEARRDAAFACMAELLRLGRAGLASDLATELRRLVPDDPETAFLPPDPPPGLSPATYLAFDDEHGGPVWPWRGPEAARREFAGPRHCAGLGAFRMQGGEDGWPWAEAGAEIAATWRAIRGGPPSCEPLGTFLAWLVAGQARALNAWTIPPELRAAWSYSYPEARRFVRPDDASVAETARLAAELVREGEARSEKFRAWFARFIAPPRPETDEGGR